MFVIVYGDGTAKLICNFDISNPFVLFKQQSNMFFFFFFLKD